MEICLSFDNGPEPEATPGVLAVLARRRIPAMFFVVGEKLRDPKARALAAQARDAGHVIGNHTLTHGAPLGRRSAAEALHEITETDVLLGDLAAPERYFRPNGGGGALGAHLLNGAAARHLIAAQATMVLWNAVPGDFRDAEGWPATAHAMLSAARAPVMLVLHDLPNGAMRHLDRFLGEVQDQGWHFRRDPPPGCVPLRRGIPGPDFARYICCP
ncbi:MAG: polysaccharide deacetylase family protein [Roseomonas sp.]|nr:polysaccharide deacetylase family protein [Roseomonas sp.]MCA3429662.1 polysaccharide deacetylase family protein [Roseomonas sp.]MCA3433534.1 polysaccharide deacetylase family protein [Roseomonas sp.]